MQVISLNIGRPALHAYAGRQYSSSINRSAVAGPVELTPDGFAGDRVADSKNHGGPDKAACCFAIERYAYFAANLGRELPIPAFGENLTTRGLLEEQVCIGDVLRIGGATVQITQPRQPCYKLVGKHDARQMSAWINETGYSGFYVRTLEPGAVRAGDEITLVARPHPEWTVARALRAMLAGAAAREELTQLAALPELSAAWRADIAEKLAGD